MKNTICFLFLIFTSVLSVSAQENFVWTEVVKVDSSLSQKELYNRAKLYIAQNFVSSKDVTQLNNDDAFTIVIKPVHQVGPLIKGLGAGFTSVDAGYVHYTLTLIAKDGKYKYTIEDCYHTGIGKISDCGPLAKDEPGLSTFNGGVPAKFWKEKLKPDFIQYEERITTDLKANMAKKQKASDF